MKQLFFLLLTIVTCHYTGFSQKHTTAEFLETQSEHILHFRSDIHVQKNTRVRITEHIRVVAKGESIQRGIYRDIPLEYDYQGAHITVDFTILSIKRDGADEPYHTENMHNGVRIYLGEKDVFLTPGVYEYEITYEVGHVLGLFDKYDELYWNVNGNGWAFPIDTLSANVYFPPGATLKQFTGYTGGFGEDGKEFTSSELKRGVHFSASRTLVQGENLTVAVAWDKGHLTYPSALEKFIYWLRTYLLWVIGIAGLLGTLVYNFIAWYRFGRDPKPGTIAPLYYAPDNLSPAECAMITNEGRETETLFGSMLISLATKQLIHIQTEKKDAFSRVFTITLVENPQKPAEELLNDIELNFFNALFLNRTVVKIGNRNYDPFLYAVQRELVNTISNKQGETYFKSNDHLRIKQYVVPCITLLLGIITIVRFGGSLWVIGIAFVLMLALNFFFSSLYNKPTAKGRKTLDEIEGFKLYMKYADKERIRLGNPPTMDFDHFEKNLPYAIALGIAEHWAEQFPPEVMEQVQTGRFTWYSGVAFSSFGSIGFTDLSRTISSAAVPPRTSSGSYGGSGFSAGGGFSGGGFGGGGGGGW